MQRWKEEFVANTHRKCVHVHFNGNFEQGKVLYMEPDWSYLDFLNAASQRLNMVPAAKRVFNADGVEIDDCMMIEDDDILFFSHTDDFQPPIDVTTDDSTRIEGEKIPHTVGGYKVGELLGRGGFGEVRIGEHHLTGERVALKFLRKSEIHSLLAAERTNTEIQCLQALKHNNIIRLQQHLESANHVVLVFELMEGGDLAKFLVRRKNSGQSVKASLTEEEARHVFYQVLSAVSYAHNQHICHRDLKLENILLKDNSINLVKIADFGLSDFYRPGSTMKSSCGTLSFLAPEVFKGTANAGPPLDVWSLGVILFALLCGRLPFEGNDLASTKRPRDAVIKTRIMKCQYKIDDNLGPEAKDLLRRILQADPGERLTIPEIFNHIWLRTVTGAHYGDVYLYNAANNLLHSYNNGTASSMNNILNGFYSSPFQSHENTSGKSGGAGVVNVASTATLHANQHASNTVDLLFSVSPTKQKRTNSGSSQKDSGHEHQPLKQKKETLMGGDDLLMTVSEKLIQEHSNHGFASESVSGTPNHLCTSSHSDIPSRNASCKALDVGEHDVDMLVEHDHGVKEDITTSSSSTNVLGTAPPSDETKNTFKLIPLRRSNSNKKEAKASGYFDDDFLYSPHRHSFAGQQKSSNVHDELGTVASTNNLHHAGGSNGNMHGTSSWRPSTTIASGGRRNILSSSHTGGGNDEDVFSPSMSMHKEYAAVNATAANGRKDLLRASPRSEFKTEKHEGALYDFSSSRNTVGGRSANALAHSTETSPFFSRGRSTTPTGHHPNAAPSLLHPTSAQKRKDSIPAGAKGTATAASLSLSPPPNHLHDFSPSPPVSYSNSPGVTSMKRSSGTANSTSLSHRMRF